MAEDGIVGPYNGSQARDILISVDDWERMQGAQGESAAEPDSKKARTNRIVPEAHWEDESLEDDDRQSPEDEYQDDDVNDEEESYTAESA
jgi:S-DNA-T family DNA segregation ATPase FtsK/SpoIIIE